MALTTSELQRIKFELGYNLLNVGADVYIGVTEFFELILKPFLQSGAITTSSTVVSEPSPLPTAVALTLTSVVGLAAGMTVTVDVDALSESVTIQSLTGSAITVLLSKPHTGTYPVVADVLTTSSFTVVPSLVAPPRSVDLLLASAVDFAIGNTIIIDQDARQEPATVVNISGSTVTVFLNKGHSGTYPVTVEGGESIIRGILQQIQMIAPLGGQYGGRGFGGLNDAASSAGIKKVDEIEFFGPTPGVTWASAASGNALQQQMFLLNYWRDQLASAIGCPRLNRKRGSSSAIY